MCIKWFIRKNNRVHWELILTFGFICMPSDWISFFDFESLPWDCCLHFDHGLYKNQRPICRSLGRQKFKTSSSFIKVTCVWLSIKWVDHIPYQFSVSKGFSEKISASIKNYCWILDCYIHHHIGSVYFVS